MERKTPPMDDLVSLVVAKLGICSGPGQYALVFNENDPHFDLVPEGKVPTMVVRTITDSSTGELNYELCYINVTSDAHVQLREADQLPVWTILTYRRLAVAADFAQGFVRRHKVQYLAYCIDLYKASDVDNLFLVDDQGRVLAPHEGIKDYGRLDKNQNRIARHPVPDTNAMARAILTLTPDSIR